MTDCTGTPISRVHETPNPMTFDDLRLSKPIVDAVATEGHTTPTPIQQKSIPAILEGNDVLGCAPTGTGKTAAFALPILDHIANSRPPFRPKAAKKGSNGGRPRALVLSPTRELADQIFKRFDAYGRNLSLRNAVVYGGVNLPRQARRLRGRVDVLVATPGRLLDMVNRRFLKLGSVEILVLDEADRMLDMGFIHDIRKVVDMIPEKRQTLLFSATMPKEIRGLADSILNNHVYVETAPVVPSAKSIKQSVYLVERSNKSILLHRILSREGMERVLVFARTKHGADKLAKVLKKNGIDANAIHGNKSQAARNKAMDSFKRGGTSVLVATDVASRGIDVDDISHVINYDMPNSADTYVHRIGRTARAGASGVAISFCGNDEYGDLKSIEKMLDRTLPMAKDEPDLTLDQPRKTGKKSGNKGGRKPPRNRGKKPYRQSGKPPRPEDSNSTKPRKSKPKRRKSGPKPSKAGS
ncbi:MAG: DEAD/DEAH box helicase [Phycisphaerales bacterium]|nr:DEAD/DEAH box helicase [Phycisphaerales bacterium]